METAILQLREFDRKIKRYSLSANRIVLFSAHQMGTCRMGVHPSTSVVDGYHQVHGTKGLFISSHGLWLHWREYEINCRREKRAREKRIPLLLVSASGGARMHEGIFSLMQMAKTSVALAHLSEAHIPFLSLLITLAASLIRDWGEGSGLPVEHWLIGLR